jgi:5-methylcytosine-specific restriction protein B
MFDESDDLYYRTLFLVSQYHERETYRWKQLKESAEQTTTVIRDVVENLVEHYDRIGDQELKTLYRLCQNPSRGLSTAEKRDRVRNLDLPPADIERITDAIDDSVGSVGAAMQEPELYVGGRGDNIEAEQKLHDCFERIVGNYDAESELLSAVSDLITIEFHKVQSGRISPILHYLAPAVFPVINGRSSEGMELCHRFSDDKFNVSTDLSAYVDERERYLEMRDAFDFKSHLRDLDYFLHWVQSDENQWTAVMREGIERDAWQTYPGSVSKNVPERKWPVWTERDIISVHWIGNPSDPPDNLGGQTRNFISRISPGDIIVAKGGAQKLLGLGVAAPEGHEYVGGTDREIAIPGMDEAHINENIRHVDWVLTRQVSNGIDTGDWNLSKDFANQRIVHCSFFNEIRWQLYKNHHDEVLSALESLESKSVAYATGQVREGPDDDSDKENDRPARATEIKRQLEKKNQVVFYGPPGTGKTYTAERFARWWVRQQETSDKPDDRIDTVTFHPSFTYEDFVEGLSAKTDTDGQVAYEVEDGSLKRIRESAMDAYKKASADGTEPPRYVLIIDEINRGNLAQIFGELITLLEADKRGTFTVDLAHSGETVTLPPNLYIIGTMNTADQSIALVDTALRRRFRFIDFPPDLDVVWSEEPTTTPDAYAAVTERDESISQREQLLGASVLAVRELNNRILSAPELGKGKQLGHTYLLGHTSATEVVDAWRYDILPQLEEYYFGQFDRLQNELLTETGELLIQWENEQIQSFGPEDLYTALCNVAGIENPAPLAPQTDETRTDGSDGQGMSVDAWEAGTKTVEAFRERSERILSAEAYQRVDRLLSVGDEVGWLDTGRGEKNASVQLKTDVVDPGVAPLQIKQDGTLNFKWDWLAYRQENDLTGEFLNEAAAVFNEIEEYEHKYDPDAEEGNVFDTQNIRIQDLSDEEFNQLIDGFRSFVQDAAEFQDG